MTDILIAKKALLKLKKAEIYFWCSCDKSINQPSCDGSHKHTGMTPIKFTAPASKKVLFCDCKKSVTSPLFDGIHSKR
ncbi:MAG: CDGSH iron-sulfur domain-containing protein [Pseudomonadota bacterium]|nr:CDGSH iron-sulfur domain-containing protein [Pseudomonadota bacterium]